MMDWGGGGMMGVSGFGFMGMIFGALFIAGFVLLVVWIVRGSVPGGTSTVSSSNDALQILMERFAKGELNKEEFAEMKKELIK